jgi:hypothetical protein
VKDELFNFGGARCANDHLAYENLIRMNVGTDMIDPLYAAQRRLHCGCIAQITDQGVHRAQCLRFSSL